MKERTARDSDWAFGPRPGHAIAGIQFERLRRKHFGPSDHAAMPRSCRFEDSTRCS